jgi:O-antigen/teichoic acid export membrane protein
VVKSSLAWMALAQGCAFALQFAASVVLARYLTPYETGVYAVALATVGVLSLMQALGLQSLIVREEILTPEIGATAFTVNACIAVALSISIAAISIFGSAFLHDEGVQKVLLTLAGTPLFGIFNFLPSALLERNGRFKAMALIGTASGVVATITTITLAVHGFSYMSIAYAQWVGAAAYTIMANIVGYQYSSFRLGFKSWRRVGNFGVQMLAVSGVASVSQRFSDIMLARLLGLSALGIYNRASGLNGLIWNNIHLVIARVIFVDYAGAHRRGVPLRDRYLRTVEIMTATLWPAFAGLGILSRPFIMTVYGEKWLPAATPLLFLALASMIQVAITMTWELFAATGELRTQTRIEFIRAVLALLAFVAGCTISITAAAAARVLDAVFAFFLYRPHLNRMTGTSLADFSPIYAKSALLTALAITPAVLTMASFRMSAEVPLTLIAGAILLGILFWACGLLALRHPLLEEIRNTVRRLSNRFHRDVRQDGAT